MHLTCTRSYKGYNCDRVRLVTISQNANLNSAHHIKHKCTCSSMLTQQVKLTWVPGANTVHYGKRDLIKNRHQPPLDTTCSCTLQHVFKLTNTSHDSGS